jgi:hypothetical protein
MLGRPVSPSDCALAFAIPLTESAFLADLEEAAPKDLAKSLRRRFKYRGPVLYAETYERLVALALHVAAEAEALGVAVYKAASLADMPMILAKHKVVTLVAHWRFLNLGAGDVLDLAGFQRQLACSEAAGREDDEDGQRPVDVLLRGDPLIRAAATPADLAVALNRLLLPSQRYYQWSPRTDQDERPADTAAVGGLTRVLLEEMFPGCFAPGPCLELADRLCSVWEFIDRVPERFDGVLDLTVCNSLILAEALRRRRCFCTVLGNAKPASADVRLIIYRHVIRSLSHRAEAFEDIMARAVVSLINQIRRINEPPQRHLR